MSRKSGPALLALLVIFGCSHQPFEGFKPLSLVRSDIPIGAQWQQGIGPNGLGASSNNLTTVSSFDALETSEGLGAEIKASLFERIQLSAQAINETSIKLRKIEVLRVSDLEDVSSLPGTEIIYEAIRVGQIEIDTLQKYSTNLRHIASPEISSIEISTDSNGRTKAIANNVFIAYRVVSFGEATVSSNSATLSGSLPLSLGEYTVEVHAGHAIKCMCPYDGNGRMQVGAGPSPRVIDQCAAQYPLVVVVSNSSLGQVGSGGLERVVSYKWHAPSITLDTRFLSGKIEVDILRVRASLGTMVQANCLYFSEGLFNKEHSNVEIVTVTYPITSQDSPVAAGGW